MKLKSILPFNLPALPGRVYLVLFFTLLACLHALFPASQKDPLPDCEAVPSYQGVFGVITKKPFSLHYHAYISFIADDKSEYRLLLKDGSPLYSAVGRGRVSLIEYHRLLDLDRINYFYPVTAELVGASKPLLTCEDYRAEQTNSSKGFHWKVFLLLACINYLLNYGLRLCSTSFGKEKREDRELLGCAEYTLLILISLAVIVAQFPTTIRDTFPSCEQSSRLSGSLSPGSRAADGKLELLTDGGQRVALYRPETLGALPAANRWQIWVTPYHPDSLQQSTLYPVRMMADEQQLLGCEEYHHFVAGVLDQQQLQLYMMLAAMLVTLFSLWRIIARMQPTPSA